MCFFFRLTTHVRTGCCYASKTKVGATRHRFRIKGLRHASADHPLQHQDLPARPRGALRTAFRTALELVQDRHSPQQELEGLKLFLLAPRMLLRRASREPRIPPNELDRKCEAFNRSFKPERGRESHAPPGVSACSAQHSLLRCATAQAPWEQLRQKRCAKIKKINAKAVHVSNCVKMTPLPEPVANKFIEA